MFQTVKNLALNRIAKSDYRLTDTLGDGIGGWDAGIGLTGNADHGKSSLRAKSASSSFAAQCGNCPSSVSGYTFCAESMATRKLRLPSRWASAFKTVEAHLTKAIVRCTDYMGRTGRRSNPATTTGGETRRGVIMDNHSSTVREFSAKALIKQEAGAWIVQIDQGPLQQPTNQRPAAVDGPEQLPPRIPGKTRPQTGTPWPPCNNSHPLFPISEPAAAQPTLIQRIKQRLSPPVWGSALASLALLVIVFSIQQPNQFQTRVGQQAMHQLPDGTSLSLNTNSQVRIDYSTDRRAVHLLRGEAHFDVVKNPERPFMVYAGEGVVWAVGTAFNVRFVADHQDSFVDVTVNRRAPSKSLPQLDQALPINQPQPNSTPAANQGPGTVCTGRRPPLQYSEVIQPTDNPAPTALEQKLAWQQGALIFKGETLQQASKRNRPLHQQTTNYYRPRHQADARRRAL